MNPLTSTTQMQQITQQNESLQQQVQQLTVQVEEQQQGISLRDREIVVLRTGLASSKSKNTELRQQNIGLQDTVNRQQEQIDQLKTITTEQHAQIGHLMAVVSNLFASNRALSTTLNGLRATFAEMSSTTEIQANAINALQKRISNLESDSVAKDQVITDCEKNLAGAKRDIEEAKKKAISVSSRAKSCFPCIPLLNQII